MLTPNRLRLQSSPHIKTKSAQPKQADNDELFNTLFIDMEYELAMSPNYYNAARQSSHVNKMLTPNRFRVKEK